MKKVVIIIVLAILFSSCSENEIEIEPIYRTSFTTSIRGLFCVNDSVYWVSGANGVVGLFNDNELKKLSKNKKWNELDFRDVHAFNENEAIIMSSGDGCEIYKTKNAQKSWELVYKNDKEGIFFDGMDFWDDYNGIAFSDPVDNHLVIIKTKNGGDTWEELTDSKFPKTLLGEAGFAASGTGITCVGDSTAYIGTGGGKISRVFISHNRGKNWEVVSTEMMKGEASGIYSLVFMDEKNGVAVGGNYLDSLNTKGNCVITSDGGLTWKVPETPPTGYRSCVSYNGEGLLICTGRNGIDISYDKGNNWKHISDDAYYSCVVKGSKGWMAGRNGKMAKVIIK